MHFVYFLQSRKNKSLYIGCTNNLRNRILLHNNAKSYHTSKFIPWQLVYFEGFASKLDAFQREKALKHHAQGLRRLKERLQDSLEM